MSFRVWGRSVLAGSCESSLEQGLMGGAGVVEDFCRVSTVFCTGVTRIAADSTPSIECRRQ